MGHIEYYLQYKDQPTVFRRGGNPGRVKFVIRRKGNPGRVKFVLGRRRIKVGS